MSITSFLEKPSLSNLVRNSLRRLTRNSYVLPFEYLIITFLFDIALTNSSACSSSAFSPNSLKRFMQLAMGSHFSYFEGLPTCFLASGKSSLYFLEPTRTMRPVASFLT